MAFHVFVEGAVDSSPAGIERLAAAVAEHYGLPVADLRARLARGRFRVKGNCDRETADLYARDLTKLGARCTIESGEAAARTSSPAIRASAPSLPPRNSIDPPTLRPSKNMQSGLAAAFNADPAASSSLGALEDGGMLKLSSVDGADDAPAPAPAAAFAPPARPETGTRVPVTPPKAAAAPPVDMFAPPDAEAAAFNVELADDEVERAAKKRASIPPANEPEPEPEPQQPPSRSSRPSLQHVPAASASASAPTGLADPKIRFALGVLVAIVIGFVPAHLLASVREKSAYAEIDSTVEQTQREADSQDTYDALDAFRARQLTRKYDARQSAAILAMLVWAAAGGAIAFVWFRRIRWPE
jgi:hypothetical protein